MDGGDSDMTLAFELAALQSLASPSAVVTDARQWSEYVGVVSEEPTYVVTNFTRQEGIRQDFFSGPRGVQESLESVRTQFETGRYVFVGTTDEDAAIAERAGWEHLAIEEAAEAADWQLGTGEGAAPGEEDVREDWP